jgi:hypothetical protein
MAASIGLRPEPRYQLGRVRHRRVLFQGFAAGQPTAATTRWRITTLPSTPLPVPGVGRARWLVELIRCRAGDSANFELEACDAKGRLALPAELAHRPTLATQARM